MEHHLITFSACVAIILLSLFSIMSKIMKPEEVDSKVYTFVYYATLIVGLYFSMEFFKLIVYFNHLPFSM
jgi:TctA family transporter